MRKKATTSREMKPPTWDFISKPGRVLLNGVDSSDIEGAAATRTIPAANGNEDNPLNVLNNININRKKGSEEK